MVDHLKVSSHLVWSPCKISWLFLWLCASMREITKIFRMLWCCSIRMGELWPRNTLLPHICYHTKFHLNRSNCLGESKGVPKFCGILGPALKMGAWLIPNMFLCPCYTTTFGRSRSNHMSITIGDPPEKFDPSRPTFQGHLRSLEPTHIDRLPTTSF